LRCRADLPDPVRARIDSNLAAAQEHWHLVKSAYQEAATAFQAKGLECVVLKGFSHRPLFTDDPAHRWQGDIDLLFPADQLLKARDVALGLGYEPITPFDRHPINHLPTLIRKTGWEWRGRHFDPEIPVSLELHFQFWDSATERFGPTGLENFWDRRETREVGQVRFVSFHQADVVATAALHMLSHLLRGALRPFHVYEIGWFLHCRADDADFWSEWSRLHDESLRRLQAICFAIAYRWFDCRLPSTVAEEIDRLPPELARWLETHALSPLIGFFHPNKDELWLHWNLLDSRRDRLAVLRRRLLPERLPGPVAGVHVPKEKLTWRIRSNGCWRYVLFTVSRTIHHVRALPSTAASAIRWFGTGAELGSDFWRFFIAEGFFDFGMFVFFFLYNLYLLQLGFRENFLGTMSGLMTAGSMAGSIVAVAVMRRYGLRTTLLTGFVLTACVAALRAYITLPPALLGLAAAAGLSSAAWPVALSPVVAKLTTEKSRTFGFSLVCSSGIAIGIVGGLVAAHMPAWLLQWHVASSTTGSYRLSLLIGCVFILLAAWRFSRIKLGTVEPAERTFHRPSPVLIRFLTAMAVWNLGTGAMNPFFSVFFARSVRLPVEKIGTVFAISQIVQVLGILLAPLVFRKCGLTQSISGMQYATAFALIALAIAGGPVWAAAAYAAYMMFQYMSEPGMFTLLMEGISEGERSSASALNFLVTFCGQAVAAAVAGKLITNFGYPPVMIAAAIICAAAAFLFRVLLAKSRLPAPSGS
jgi:predicted MFS family arabinose efflux permease